MFADPLRCNCCRSSLASLTNAKTAAILAESDVVNKLESLRMSIRSAESEQNTAVEVEDFAKAESLDGVIADLKRQLEDTEAKHAAFGSELARLDAAIEAEFQNGTVSITESVIALQTHVARQQDDLGVYTTSTDKRARQAADRIATEQEQLRIKQEHVDLDDKLLAGEQQQVESAIESQTSENIALAHSLEVKQVELRMEIEELEAQLARKRQEEAATTVKLAEVHGEIETVRVKYSKQLDRLRAKRDVVEGEKRECDADAEALARAKQELDAANEEAASTIAKAKAHIAAVHVETSVAAQLRDMLALFAAKRVARVHGVVDDSADNTSAAAVTLAKLKVNASCSCDSVDDSSLFLNG